MELFKKYLNSFSIKKLSFFKEIKILFYKDSFLKNSLFTLCPFADTNNGKVEKVINDVFNLFINLWDTFLIPLLKMNFFVLGIVLFYFILMFFRNKKVYNKDLLVLKDLLKPGDRIEGASKMYFKIKVVFIFLYFLIPQKLVTLARTWISLLVGVLSLLILFIVFTDNSVDLILCMLFWYFIQKIFIGKLFTQEGYMKLSLLYEKEEDVNLKDLLDYFYKNPDEDIPSEASHWFCFLSFFFLCLIFWDVERALGAKLINVSLMESVIGRRVALEELEHSFCLEKEYFSHELGYLNEKSWSLHDTFLSSTLTGDDKILEYFWVHEQSKQLDEQKEGVRSILDGLGTKYEKLSEPFLEHDTYINFLVEQKIDSMPLHSFVDYVNALFS